MRKFVLLMMIAGCWWGCRGETTAPAASRVRPIIVGTIGDLDTTNDFISQSAFTADLVKKLYLPLFKEQPDFQEHPPSFLPGLAERYDFSPDGKTLTCRLRPGAVWSDGVPITSADVAFTAQAAASAEVAWTGSDAKQFITAVETPDAATVIFKFSRRYPYQIMDANEGVIYPRHVFGKVPFSEWHKHDFSQDRVFSGPYLLKDWRRQEFYALEGNERCPLMGAAMPWPVVFRVVPDQTALLTQLLSHTVDVMEVVPPRDVDRVKRDPRIEVVAYPDRQYVYVGWNLKHPFLKSRDVRRALSHAINVQEIVDTVWYGYAKPAVGPVHSSLWAFNRSLKPFPYDPEKAGTLLREQGFTDTNGDGTLEKDGKPFEIEILTNKGNAIREATLILVQNQLAKVGVKVVARPLEWNVFVQKLMGREFDACVQGMRVPTKLDLKDTWHTTAIENGLNVISYSNPKVDALIDRARAVEDYHEAKAFLEEAQALIVDDQPFTFLYENQRLNGLNRRIRNAKMNVLSTFFNLEDWTAAE